MTFIRLARSHLVGPALLLAVGTACGGRTTEPVASAELVAVNGARVAPVFPTDTVTWAGFGFGPEQGDGAVAVTTGDGIAAATVTHWADGEIRAVLPGGVTAGPTYVLTPTDSLGALDLFALPVATFDPAGRAWEGDAPLPVALHAPGAGAVRFAGGATISSLVVVAGGRRNDSLLNADTWIGTVASNGRITGWQQAPDTLVPAPRRLHTIAGADRLNSTVTDLESVAYMVGGMDSAGRVLADVLGLGVSSTGGYTLWTPLAPLPDRRAGAATLVAFGKLYAFGGFGSDSLASRGVAYATIRPSGTLNGWFRGPPLPEGRAFAAAVAVGSTLLVLGGERGIAGIVDPDTLADTTSLTASIYAIRVSPLSGAFRDTAWTELPVTLNVPRSRFAAAVVDDAVLIGGGIYAGMPSAAETAFAVLADGLPGTFQEIPGTPLADLAGGAIWGGAAPVLWGADGRARLTVLGGSVGAAPTSLVFSY